MFHSSSAEFGCRSSAQRHCVIVLRTESEAECRGWDGRTDVK